MEDKPTLEPVNRVVMLYSRQELKRKLQLIDRNWRKQYYRQSLLLGGFFLICIAIFFYFIYLNQPSKNHYPIAKLQQLFDDHFSPYPTQNIRGGGSIAISTQALIAYDKKSYAESIDLFRQLDQSKSSVQLYLSNALLATSQFEKAIPILEKLSQSKVYSTQGQWYLALVLIQQNSIEEAREVLGTLSLTRNSYQQPAKDLLEALNEN